jgi:hypothetical protein
MTDDEMKAHPAYLLALNHACATADIHALPSRLEREPGHYDRHDWNARQAAHAIGQDLRREVEAAQARCEAAGHRFTPSGVLLGRVQ